MITTPSHTGPKQSVVLVIDPDPANQRRMRDNLMNMGYVARSVDDYGAALNIISSTPPDVVLVTGHPTRRESLSDLHTELNKWGIPIINLDDAVDPLSTGFLPEATPSTKIADLRLRIDAALRARSLQDTLLTENARLSAERLQDPLTGLYNRRYVLIRIEEEVMRSSRRGHPLSCLLVDIDGFDKVNETWGHPVGDTVLRDMAHLVVRTMRGSDITSRYRDDQFLVLLTDTDAEGAQIAANRLRDATVEHSFFNQLSGEPIKLTASIGVAYWVPNAKGGQSDTWEPQLLGLCERALRAAKQSGTNRLVILQA